MEATARCFLELIRTRSFQKGELLLDDEQYVSLFLKKTVRFFQPVGLKHVNLFKASKELAAAPKKKTSVDAKEIKETLTKLKDVPFLICIIKPNFLFFNLLYRLII